MFNNNNFYIFIFGLDFVIVYDFLLDFYYNLISSTYLFSCLRFSPFSVFLLLLFCLPTGVYSFLAFLLRFVVVFLACLNLSPPTVIVWLIHCSLFNDSYLVRFVYSFNLKLAIYLNLFSGSFIGSQRRRESKS